MSEPGSKQLVTVEFGVRVAEVEPEISYRQEYRYWTPNAADPESAIEAAGEEYDEVLSSPEDVERQVVPAPEKWSREEHERYGSRVVATDGGEPQESGSERLRSIEQMAEEYEQGAENRGEEINAANYRNIRTAIENLRADLEDDGLRADGSGEPGTEHELCSTGGCDEPRKPCYTLCEGHLERGGEIAALVGIMALVLVALLGFAAGGGL